MKRKHKRTVLVSECSSIISCSLPFKAIRAIVSNTVYYIGGAETADNYFSTLPTPPTIPCVLALAQSPALKLSELSSFLGQHGAKDELLPQFLWNSLLVIQLSYHF